MLIFPFVDVSHAGCHVHLMLMSRDTDVTNTGTTWRRDPLTLTIPATDVCYTHPKCSKCISCLSRMIAMLDIVAFIPYGACHVVSWCNLCIPVFQRGSLDDMLDGCVEDVDEVI